MLKKQSVILGMGMLLLPIHFTQAQLAPVADPVESTQVGPVPDDTPLIPGATFPWAAVDPVTFEVTDLATTPSDEKKDYSAFNTPDQKEARRKMLLRASDPLEYFKEFPESDEEKAAQDAAIFAGTHPISYTEKMAQIKDPEILNQIQRSLDLILRPVETHEKDLLAKQAAEKAETVPAVEAKP